MLSEVGHDFVWHCIMSGGESWPKLYDIMCREAARRRFRNMDMKELKLQGISFSMTTLDDLYNDIMHDFGFISINNEPTEH